MSSETSPVPSPRGITRALLWLAVATVACLPAVASSCRRSCGDVAIPYPFGMKDDQPGCAIPGFEVSCKRDGLLLKPFLSDDVEVRGILLAESQVRIKMDISWSCYNTINRTMDSINWFLSFRDTPYRLSDTGNKFTVIGCRTLAYITITKPQQLESSSLTTGCVATCNSQGDLASLSDGTCSGIGCCQTTIPKGLQNYGIWFDDRFNTAKIYNMSRCSYAALVEASNFTFSTSYAMSSAFNDTYAGQAPLLLDWAIGNQTCEAARRNPNPDPKYACISNNSDCFNSSNGPGYICKCKEGFHGNPYLDDPELGCKDINECTDWSKYPCAVPGTCVNTPGAFKCVCPPGYPKGNAQNGTCERDQLPLSSGAKIAIGGQNMFSQATD
ncbi:Os04g0369600 [Oryza sativa Japonica Group]|uniref:Os04g0369600 protein n=1 Tax=Oryza sativa subsp. japonica TaxID=39947 RepID=A0A0P0W996_ORYSJ|nr:Os04g0369600 [Oryza sativa Japonica Group]